MRGQEVQMRCDLHVFAGSGPESRKVHLAGNPLAILLLVCVLLWLALFAHSAAKFTWDHYGAYEGTVVEIKRHWIDDLTSESNDVERLTIRTPQGRLIVKCVGFQTRVTSNIREGDYVVKPRGFSHRIRRREARP